MKLLLDPGVPLLDLVDPVENPADDEHVGHLVVVERDVPHVGDLHGVGVDLHHHGVVVQGEAEHAPHAVLVH